MILPAVARVKLTFGAWFYLPLALLHGSLIVRLAGGYEDPGWRTDGAALNALALALFGAVVVGSAVVVQRRQRRRLELTRATTRHPLPAMLCDPPSWPSSITLLPARP